MAREVIILACTECKAKNYVYSKNKRLHPERVEYKKFCPKVFGVELHIVDRPALMIAFWAVVAVGVA